MPKYVRKISLAKWKKGHSSLIPSDANADAITGCSRTNDNTLSIWKIENDNQVNEAILAMSSSMQRLEGFDILLIEEDKIKDDFEIEQTEGNTAVLDLRNNHYDIKGLKYSSLGRISELIISEINEGHVRKITKNTIKEVLNAAILEGRLLQERLHVDLASEL